MAFNPANLPNLRAGFEPRRAVPLAAEMLRRAAARPVGQRVPIIGALVISWILMEPQQVGTLVHT